VGNLPYCVQEAPAHVFVTELGPTLQVALGQADPILCILLRRTFQPTDLPKAAGNGRALEPDLLVIHSIDIAHEHIYPAIVSTICHGQHLVECLRSGQQRHDAPKRPATQMCTANALKFVGSGHFDHRHSRPDIDQEVGVDIRLGFGKLHRLCLTVSEDFIGDFIDEEVEAYMFKHVTWSASDGRRDVALRFGCTSNQTFHLILPQNIHLQRLFQSVIVLVGTTSCGHHA
jgi:hypothetical protein